MMANMSVKMEGLDELRKKLSKMSDSKEYEDKALTKAGEHLRDKLEDNVYSYGLKKRSGKSQKSFVVNKTILKRRIEVGLSNQNNDAFYLYFHEYGTSKMIARPFFRPTFEQEKGKLEQIMAQEIRKGLGL